MRLHLGCGQNIIAGWTNLDLEPGRGGIKADLTAPLPYIDNSVDLIFTEHFIEHITHQQGRRLFKECFRVLRPGGVLRVSTPDLRKLVNDYIEQDVIKIPGVWEPATPAQMLNEGMRLWGHQFVYDNIDLRLSLWSAGFAERAISFVPYHVSERQELRAIEHRPDMGELIVEAVK